MIDQILKDHKPGEKPRFFLHDEMKAWLGDHLNIVITTSPNSSYDQNLASKLGVPHIVVGHSLTITLYLDNEPITVQGVNIIDPNREQVFKTLANVCEKCMIEINDLTYKVGELRRRLDLIENPIV